MSNNNSNSNSSEDEWIFRVVTPDQTVCLRQRQPSSLRHIAEEPSSMTEETIQNNEADDERAGLLPTTTDNGDDDDDGIPPLPRTKPQPKPVWTFSSPHWSLENTNLLSVTYSPAYQTLPSYTEQCRMCASNSKTASNTLLRTCGVRWCGRYCRNHRQKPVDVVCETWTVADIVGVVTEDTTTTTTNIDGVGPCQSVQLRLRPLTALSDHSTIPEAYREEWEEQLRHAQRNATGVDVAVVRDDKEENDTTPTNESELHNTSGPLLTFCLPIHETDPPLLWKVSLPAVPDYPIAVDTITVLDGRLQTTTSTEQHHDRAPTHHTHHNPTHIYINGYQSWSFTGSILRGQAQPGSALPDAFSRAFNLGGSAPVDPTTTVGLDDNDNTNDNYNDTDQHTYHYTSDFFTCVTSDGRVAPRGSTERQFPYTALDERGGPALLLGWLSQHKQFGVVQGSRCLSQFRMHASASSQLLHTTTKATTTTGNHNNHSGTNHTSITTDWAYAQLVHPHSYDEEPLANYLHAVAAHNHARPLQNGSLLTGYCTWYVFYEKIHAKLLRDNVQLLAGLRTQVPTNVVVVDDGYMTAWGDWGSLKTDAFPDGMAVVAQQIRVHGMRPGIWLAPFAADKHSVLVRDHPDWILRNDAGIPANSSHCGKFFYGLDATHPDVRQHVADSIYRAVHEWDFDVLKIDFLYAACLDGNGRYDSSMSRAQAMLLAMKTIRDAAGPNVFLIGCGCPMGTGIGYVDAMRISADTGPTWTPPLPLPWWDNGTLPALRSMIRNSMARAPMGHRWWHNDPDCLMLGNHTSLTDDEVASSATVVAMTCGMLLLSDDLPKVSESRMQIVSKIFPLTGVSAVVLDLHSTHNGLPSLMRLWCTDKYSVEDTFDRTLAINEHGEHDHNAEATHFARMSSFRLNTTASDPTERKRSCIFVAKGMGTWTVVSISNWSDKAAVVRVPPPALNPPPKTGWNVPGQPSSQREISTDAVVSGFHVFGFWSSKYSWLSDDYSKENSDPDHTVCKKLGPHATEVFHIKKVTPTAPQYIGSDFHFSCGQEVSSLEAKDSKLSLSLKTAYRRHGFIFLYIPRVNLEHTLQATVNGERALWNIEGNVPTPSRTGSGRIIGRIIRVAVTIHADGSAHDGQVSIDF